MTAALIKVAAHGSVAIRSLGARHGGGPETVDPMIAAIQALEATIRQRDETIEALRRDVVRAFDEGRAEGHEQGLIDADDRQMEHLEIVAAASREAVADLNAALGALERLAPALARDGLAIVFGADTARAALVTEIIARQMQAIDAESIVEVRLAATDFAEPDALVTLTARIGDPRVSLALDPKLDAGGCTIRLRIGEIVVGIDQQWEALGGLLSDLARPGRGS